VKQRGRQSAAALATVTPLPIRLLAPPPDLSPEEAQVWAGVVATKPGDWWDAATIPLLAQYCRAVALADLLGDQVRQCAAAMLTDPDQLGTLKELRKMQAQLSGEMKSLATSMRLTQQSRYNAKNSDTASRRVVSRKPWQHHDVLDAD
jgi:hypothetical protein